MFHHCTKHDILIFFAGVFAMHALGHIVIAFSNMLPLMISFNAMQWTLTAGMNKIIIIVSALLTAGCLWLACKEHSQKPPQGSNQYYRA